MDEDTSGTIEVDELKEAFNKLKARYDRRKSILKPGERLYDEANGDSEKSMQ